jgi:hypothetical protein
MHGARLCERHARAQATCLRHSIDRDQQIGITALAEADER